MLKRIFPIFIATLFIGTQAEAQQISRSGGGWGPTGVYVAAKTGIFATKETSFRTQTLTIYNAYDDPGYQGAVALGWGARTGKGWGYRLEIEGGYQESKIESHTIRGAGRIGGDDAFGDAQVLFGFVNAYTDVSLAHGFDLVAGGGIGAGRVAFDDFGVSGARGLLDDSDTAFGYHFDAGFAFDVTPVATLEATYRFTRFVDADAGASDGSANEIDLETHALLIGARLKL